MTADKTIASKPKILVATTARFFTFPLKDRLESRGFQVIYSEYSPHHPSNVPQILIEVETTNPDAVLIDHPNLDLEESRQSCAAIVDACRGKIPVVLSGSRCSTNRLTQIGSDDAKCLSTESSAGGIAFEIEQMVKDRNPQR